MKPRAASANRPSDATLILLLAAAAAFLGGCGDSPLDTGGAADAPPEAAIDLAQAWGGLTDTDEAANFGDPELGRLAAIPAPVTDPLAGDPRVMAQDAAPGREVVFLRVVWGHLARNAEDSTAAGLHVEWDGQLATSSGVLLVQNLIKFEGQDSIVRPRTDPQILAFASDTYGGVDGILVRVVFNPDSTDAGDLLTFATAPLTVSFPLVGLADLDTVLAAGGPGHGVAFTAVEDDRRGECVGGLVEGIWRHGLERGGHFRGIWTTPNGFLFAVMRGRFGVLPDGRPVLIGKVIGPHGGFLGFVKGHYWVGPGGGTGGWRALWHGRDRDAPVGGLGGHWVAREDGSGAGFLSGRWGKFCPDYPPPD